jgi:ATP-dependent RNA helicase DeaD
MSRDLAGSGLDERLTGAAAAAGFDRLTPLQEAALPVLRRGGNALLYASAGAGVTAAYGLPLLDRLLAEGRAEGGEDVAGPRAVVLAPTPERAEDIARELGRLGADAGLAVRAAAPGWQAEGADVMVTTASLAMQAVQDSALKLAGVQAVVLADLDRQYQMKNGAAVESFVALVPKDAQRVITAADPDGVVQKFVDAHARRALTIPSRPADPAQSEPGEPLAQIGYMVVQEPEKLEMAARLLDGAEGDVVVRVRSAARAEQAASELRRRGIRTAAGDDVGVVDFEADSEAGSSDRVLSLDVPFDVDQIRRIHAGGGSVLVTPSELAHFQRLVKEAPFTAKQRRARTFQPDELETFRQVIRDAVEGEDLGAQMLVLQPLFDAHSPAEVAAALSALLRRRPAPKGARPSAGAAAGAAGASAAGGAPPAGAGGFTRLFISIGERDNVRAGDIVGAMTGEAGIKGDQVGRVDIRDTFSVVEVAIQAADRVIRALNGTTMRGRSLRVDYDRKSGAATGGGGGGSRGPSRGGPRGPRPPGGPRDRDRGPGGSDRPRREGGDRPPSRRPDR